MTRRVDKSKIESWDEQRVDLRIQLKVAEEKGPSDEGQRELVRRILAFDKLINDARGGQRTPDK